MMQVAEQVPSKPRHPGNPNWVKVVSQNTAGKEGKAKRRARIDATIAEWAERSRNANDFKYRFPFIEMAIKSLPVRSCWIDG